LEKLPKRADQEDWNSHRVQVGDVAEGTYQGERAFMLAPSEAFRRIPLGYLAFLILAVGVVELGHRLRVTRLVDGVRLGLLIGAVLGPLAGSQRVKRGRLTAALGSRRLDQAAQLGVARLAWGR